MYGSAPLLLPPKCRYAQPRSCDPVCKVKDYPVRITWCTTNAGRETYPVPVSSPSAPRVYRRAVHHRCCRYCGRPAVCELRSRRPRHSATSSVERRSLSDRRSHLTLLRALRWKALRKMSMEHAEEDTCWICLEGGENLCSPCACPRVVHRNCLAKWQLHKAGSR